MSDIDTLVRDCRILGGNDATSAAPSRSYHNGSGGGYDLADFISASIGPQ